MRVADIIRRVYFETATATDDTLLLKLFAYQADYIAYTWDTDRPKHLDLQSYITYMHNGADYFRRITLGDGRRWYGPGRFKE